MLEKLKKENSRLKNEVKNLLITEHSLYEVQSKLDKQLNHYQKIYQVIKSLNSSLTFSDIFDKILDFVIYELGFEKCIIFMYSVENKTYKVKAADGYYESNLKNQIFKKQISINNPITKLLILQRNAIIFSKENNIKYMKDLGKKFILEDYIVFPFFGETGQLNGFLITGNAEERKEYYSKVELNSDNILGFSNLVEHLSASINNIFYLQELKKHRHNLEDLVKKRTEDLNKSNTKLKNEINERKQIEKELRDAITKINALEGIIPICAHCKKIRDDKGFWNQIEVFIENYSLVEFSHSICPECVNKLYPDLEIEEEKK